MKKTPEEIGRKMIELDAWSSLATSTFAIKPKGTVFPYFCAVRKEDGKPVKVRFLMLEGWQTLHSYLILHADRNFGVYQSPMEMPHFELAVTVDGDMGIFRHDTCYMPRMLKDSEKDLVSKIMWESYGVMLRIESDGTLPMRFAGEKAMFGRVEKADGKWEDCPMTIPTPPPYVEEIKVSKDLIKKAKDLPFVAGECLEIGFRLVPMLMTNEPRPRCCYRLLALGPKDEHVIDAKMSANPAFGLKDMWTSLASEVLRLLVERGSIPGEIKVPTARLFRMLRPLCMEIPFKLSMHDSLPRLQSAFAS